MRDDEVCAEAKTTGMGANSVWDLRARGLMSYSDNIE